MKPSLLDVLVDPISKTALRVEVLQSAADGSIVEGTLRSREGRSYRIVNGIPRFVLSDDKDQRQTANSFSFKWYRRKVYEAPEMRAFAETWLVQRYGFRATSEMRDFFGRGQRILDAGCGSGFSTSLWMDTSWPNGSGAEWFGVDISTAIDLAQERLGSVKNTHFVQADIMQLPFAQNTFNIIFAEGVLHHTASTELSLKSLVFVLAPRGEILFYVYRKKAPIREFADDYVRKIVSSLEPEKAWSAVRPLTKLGKALAELHADIEVPEDIPYLEIKAGRYNVQRLIYWHFAKLFWNEELPFDVNNLVNFDWYHPRYAHRHTKEEILRWCAQAGLSIAYFDEQESGFTVRATKPA